MLASSNFYNLWPLYLILEIFYSSVVLKVTGTHDFQWFRGMSEYFWQTSVLSLLLMPHVLVECWCRTGLAACPGLTLAYKMNWKLNSSWFCPQTSSVNGLLWLLSSQSSLRLSSRHISRPLLRADRWNDIHFCFSTKQTSSGVLFINYQSDDRLMTGYKCVKHLNIALAPALTIEHRL